MHTRLLTLVWFVGVLSLATGGILHWVPDKASVTSSYTIKGSLLRFNVTSQINGIPFHDPSEKGHFKLQFSFFYKNSLRLFGETKCISFTKSAGDAETELLIANLSASLHSTTEQPFKNYFTLIVQKYYDSYNTTTRSTTSLLFSVAPVTRNVSVPSFQITTNQCSSIKTIGQWNDINQWVENRIPTITDDVVIPSGSGVIQLSGDVILHSANISGGLIRAQTSNCGPDWTIGDTDTLSSKCFRLIDNPMTFSDAKTFCSSSIGAGSAQRNLVKISNRNELDLLFRLCRTQSDLGCWIGLSDRFGTGNYRWQVDEEFNNIGTVMFFDWRRNEPNNHTVSDGIEALGGERCVATVSWRDDPLVEEQGGWYDEYCQKKLPFVCQSTAETVRYTLTLSNLFATGGIFEGGTMVARNQTKISLFQIFSAVLVVPKNATAIVKSLQLTDATRLEIDGSVTFEDGIVGEARSELAQPIIIARSNSALWIRGNVTVNARFSSLGTIVVDKQSILRLNQGGSLAESFLSLSSSDSSLALAGYASRLSTFDSFELRSRNRGPFVGEFYGSNVSAELNNEYKSVSKGVYRLGVGAGETTFHTRCIPFNATTDELTAILNEIQVIFDRGGVNVRRYGDAQQQAFGYGFTYRIDVDAPRTSDFSAKPLSLSIFCQGLECGCAESKVPIVDVSGQSLCNNPSNYSWLGSDTCVLRSHLSVDRITKLSFLRTRGLGQIDIVGGVHRLMPRSNVTISIQSGLGVVAADVISWLSVAVSHSGELRLAGTGWAGWDTQDFLYRSSWEDRRGLVSLNHPPSFNMTCRDLYLADDARFFCAGVGARLAWARGKWRGGVLGGLCESRVSEHIELAGNLKSLRYGMDLYVEDSARAVWTEGNISLANGAHMIVFGLLNISNADRDAVAIGEAHLLDNVEVREEPQRSWQSYYDRSLLTELRPAWYQNPLCGAKCGLVNELSIQGRGLLFSDADSKVIFLSPVRIEGVSRFDVGARAIVNMGSGGVFGNDVIVDLAIGTLLELSGGEMLMEAQCTIRGVGELVVSAGSHAMGFSVDAHITISGGTLLWPESRGTQKTITFNGGLLIRGTGELQVQPFSTTIIVHKEVQLREKGMIQFPLIGIAAQASPFDRSDAPDSSPRGNLTSTGTMRWDGGTLMGKADFYALNELFLDVDVKYIRSLAKLVNRGHCEWGEGNIVSSDNGDFQNFGTIQMKNGVTKFSSEAMYKGSELPVENGGDFFALQYHSWDSDYGSLDYSEYLLLRTRFVSKVPIGWSFESQK